MGHQAQTVDVLLWVVGLGLGRKMNQDGQKGKLFSLECMMFKSPFNPLQSIFASLYTKLLKIKCHLNRQTFHHL